MNKNLKLSTPAKFGLLGAILVLALVAGWFVVIAPKRSEASRLQTKIDEAQTQIDTAHTALSHPQAEAQPIRAADLFNLSRAMPNRADIPGVLLQLSRVAQETGIDFQSITPHDPLSLGTYQRVSVDLVFQGRFYDLSDFLFRLRNLVAVREGVLNATGRLFSVDSISFDEGELQFPDVRARLSISAYVFGDGTATLVPSPTSAALPTTTAAAEDSQPIPAAPTGATAAGA
jgi:hypothetical protein